MGAHLKLSWKTTTYGRIGTLEETLYSFLNQDDLKDTEMIIVNDYPRQTLIFNHPNVKIFNIKDTFKTIGEKDNFAVDQSNGDLIVTADDDDIYMPNHNSNIRKYWKQDTNIIHWKGVFYNKPAITAITGIGNSGMVYSRKAWENVGKHPIMNAGGDSVFSQKIDVLGNVLEVSPPDEEVSAWYMWGGRSYHQSGQGTDTPDKPNIIERHSAHIEELRQKGQILTGEITLRPKWHQNYPQMLKDFIIKQKEDASRN